MNAQADVWTKAYYGIQHRTDVPRSHQITMHDSGSLAHVYLLFLHGNRPFTPVKEHIGSRSECVEKADRWAQSLAV